MRTPCAGGGFGLSTWFLGANSVDDLAKHGQLIATIREYIENQKWDQDDQGFKITAPTEP